MRWRPLPEATTDALWEGSCRDPRLQTQGIPTTAARSGPLIPACKRGCCCFSSSSVRGTSWPRPPACLHFPDLLLILQYDDRSPHFLIAQPQVCLEGYSASGCPCRAGRCVDSCVYHCCFWVVFTLLWHMHTRTFIYAHTHTHTLTRTISHLAKAFKKLQR